jgi:hypothetical protein
MFFHTNSLPAPINTSPQRVSKWYALFAKSGPFDGTIGHLMLKPRYDSRRADIDGAQAAVAIWPSMTEDLQ